MAEPRPRSLLLLTVAILVVVIAAGAGGGLLYEHNHTSPPAGPLRVAIGDNVTVNYIGWFGSGAEIDRVFDTSILSVAKDNATYPKSLEFGFRGKGQYVPLAVHVGPNAPSGGYPVGNLTFGSVVTGFWTGMVGLQANQTHIETIPPDLGYGPINASCLVSAPLVYSIPVTIALTPSQFAKAFPNVTAATGITFPDPTYGWTDLVLSDTATSVTIENLPYLGWTSRPTGWTVKVTGLNSSSIQLTNELTVADAGRVAGTASKSFCGSQTFIVSGVDTQLGVYTENFNHEVVGETLVFEVTITAIYPD